MSDERSESVLVRRTQTAWIEVEIDKGASSEDAMDKAIDIAKDSYDWPEDPEFEAVDIAGGPVERRRQ